MLLNNNSRITQNLFPSRAKAGATFTYCFLWGVKRTDRIWLGQGFTVPTSHSPLTIFSPHSQETSSSLQLLWQTKNCRSPHPPPCPGPLPYWQNDSKMQVALCTCFSCFGTCQTSLKKISREHIQTFLLGNTDSAPWQTYRALGRSHDDSHPLCEVHFIMFPMHSVTGDSQLPKETTVLCELGGGLDMPPNAQPGRFLDGRWGSSRILKIKLVYSSSMFFFSLNLSSFLK